MVATAAARMQRITRHHAALIFILFHRCTCHRLKKSRQNPKLLPCLPYHVNMWSGTTGGEIVISYLRVETKISRWHLLYLFFYLIRCNFFCNFGGLEWKIQVNKTPFGHFIFQHTPLIPTLSLLCQGNPTCDYTAGFISLKTMRTYLLHYCS